MKFKLSITLLLAIFLISSVSAVCTVTLDQDSYNDGGIATATMLCNSHPTETSDAYTLNWTNATGFQLELDTGTTPKADGSNSFFDTYVIPSNYVAVYGSGLNATLVSTGDLEGSDNATVVAATSTDLIITDISLSSKYNIGRYGSIRYKVTNSAGNAIFNARCIVDVVDGTNLPVISTGSMIPTKSDGYILQSIQIHPFWPEGGQFKWDITCGCLNASTTSTLPGACINSATGATISSFAKTKIQQPFTLNTWLTSNTVVDKTDYTMKDKIFICANVTNVDSPLRIPLEIDYQVRCSSGTDNDNDLDRVLIIESDHIDIRGISTGSTQMQCHEFVIPEMDYLQGKTSQCYASSDAWVIDSDGSRLIGYPTTSSVFNITSTELNLDPDWTKTGTNQINSIVNLSSFTDINGTGTGNIDVRLHGGFDEIDITHALDLFNLIENVTVKNTTSTLVEGVDYTLEFLEDNNVEIEIKNVPLTKTGTEWWNITVDFYNFEDRQADALEGIENKTGTFHLDVDCPTSGQIGNSMACTINAYVEDSQTVQKEVDFTCHISDGTSTYSSVNFNQMVTKTPVAVTQNFEIPSTFTNGQQYVLQCYGDYYNLGSRRDSFYDTFTASTTSGGGGSAGTTTGDGDNETDDGRAPITGGIIGVDEDLEGEFYNPFTPKGKRVYTFFALILLLLATLIFVTSKIKTKYKDKFHPVKPKDHKLNLFKKIAGISIFLLFLLFVALGIYAFGSNLINTSQPLQESVIKDPLFRTIILSTFIIISIIVLFKVLHIRADIQIGHESPVEKYWRKKYKD